MQRHVKMHHPGYDSWRIYAYRPLQQPLNSFDPEPSNPLHHRTGVRLPLRCAFNQITPTSLVPAQKGNSIKRSIQPPQYPESQTQSRKQMASSVRSTTTLHDHLLPMTHCVLRETHIIPLYIYVYTRRLRDRSTIQGAG